MEEKLYNLDLEHRRPHPNTDLHAGDVYAFRYFYYGRERTGVLVMAYPTWFLEAINLYGEEGDSWVMDELPNDIELYEPTPEELLWGMGTYFDNIYQDHGSLEEIDAIKDFIVSCSKMNSKSDDWENWSFICNMIQAIAWNNRQEEKDNITTNDIWQLLKPELGLQFHAFRAELYCYLMGAMMIARQYNDRFDIYNEHICLFKRKWNIISWMYAMALGRIIGTDVTTFVAMVNNLTNSSRSKYIHLYIPLIDGNVDKICHYSNIEKKDKLIASINKIREMGELTQQSDDLDELYGIIFPSHLQNMMKQNKSAASVRELKQQLEEKDEQIKHWQQQAAELSEKVEELEPMRALCESIKEEATSDSIPMEKIMAAILNFSNPEVSKMVYQQLDWELGDFSSWNAHKEELKTAIIAKINNHKTEIHNHFEAGSNCTQFNGKVNNPTFNK